jgi:hypothetical protein
VVESANLALFDGFDCVVIAGGVVDACAYRAILSCAEDVWEDGIVV